MAISDNQRDDNADTRQKNQPDSVISNGVWYKTLFNLFARLHLTHSVLTTPTPLSSPCADFSDSLLHFWQSLENIRLSSNESEHPVNHIIGGNGSRERRDKQCHQYKSEGKFTEASGQAPFWAKLSNMERSAHEFDHEAIVEQNTNPAKDRQDAKEHRL